MAYGIQSTDHIHHVGIRSAIDTMGGTLNANITSLSTPTRTGIATGKPMWDST